MRFGSNARVLAKCKLKYYRISVHTRLGRMLLQVPRPDPFCISDMQELDEDELAASRQRRRAKDDDGEMYDEFGRLKKKNRSREDSREVLHPLLLLLCSHIPRLVVPGS